MNALRSVAVSIWKAVRTLALEESGMAAMAWYGGVGAKVVVH